MPSRPDLAQPEAVRYRDMGRLQLHVDAVARIGAQAVRDETGLTDKQRPAPPPALGKLCFLLVTPELLAPSLALALRAAAACPGLDPGAFAFAIPGSSPGQALQTQSGFRRNDEK